jgi:hypothetical protein
MPKNSYHRRIISALLLVSFVIFTVSLTSNAICQQNSNELQVAMDVNILSVNVENNFVVAQISLTINGIRLYHIGNVTEVPSAIQVQVMGIEKTYDVNCTLSTDFGNDTFGYSGTITNTTLYLETHGEGYPVDPNLIRVMLYPEGLALTINGSQYGPEPEWNYHFRVEDQQISFTGVEATHLQNTWQIFPSPNGGELYVYLVRNSGWVPIMIINAPLGGLLLAAIFVTMICANKRLKTEIYLTILISCPVYLFSVQTFIPPRNFASMPEFIGIVLMLLSIALFLVSLLPKKIVFAGECLSFVIMTFFVLFAGQANFIKILTLEPAISNFVYGLTAIMIISLFTRILVYFGRRKPKQSAEKSYYPYCV